jgi:predicted DNA-binding transcriptional regulator
VPLKPHFIVVLSPFKKIPKKNLFFWLKKCYNGIHTYTSKGVSMARKRINLTIPEELNEQWAKVARKHGLTKSGMVEEWLSYVLPVLEEEQPKKVLKHAMKTLAREIDMTASLFD